MKKNLMRLMTAVTLMFAATSVNAQDIGSILGSVLGGEQGEDAISGLTSIFSKDKQATTNNIIGTWSYTEPAIVFTSDNLLTKVAARGQDTIVYDAIWCEAWRISSDLQ